jgi:uncharacterized protein YjaZ
MPSRLEFVHALCIHELRHILSLSCIMLNEKRVSLLYIVGYIGNSAVARLVPANAAVQSLYGALTAPS